MYSDSSSKSEILNKQFQSVFTKKSTTTSPRLFGNKYPSIGNLSITLKGVQKLLEKINTSKAAGPDLIPGRMLNMLAPELAPIVHAMFTQSLDTGELPRDWSLANVAPIFKKGNRVLAENYRPVSRLVLPVNFLNTLFAGTFWTMLRTTKFWSKRVQPTRGWTVAASTQHKLYSLLLPPAMGARFYRFLGRPAKWTRWLAGAAAIKSG